MTAIFNELDAYAAQWLANLSAAGHVASGTVDTRSIREVQPDDVRHATQFHAFAGIGVWSHALRLAGWPDDRPVWTGSCPCQPFSVAGRRKGADDKRHLWPVWVKLIEQCRPPVVFGEQVASADGRAWLDAVRADLEALDYAVGAADLCAAGVGAPHIRQRLYFGAVRLADAERDERRQVGANGRGRSEGGRAQGMDERPLHGGAGRDTRGLADADATGRGIVGRGGLPEVRHAPFRHDADGRGPTRGVGNTGRSRAGRNAGAGAQAQEGVAVRAVGDASLAPGPTRGVGDDDEGLEGHGRPVDVDDAQGRQEAERHRPTSGFWSDRDWVLCRDEPVNKWRPVESGTFPLVNGASARVGRLRAYGNAIVSEVAATFVKAFVEAAS